MTRHWLEYVSTTYCKFTHTCIFAHTPNSSHKGNVKDCIDRRDVKRDTSFYYTTFHILRKPWKSSLLWNEIIIFDSKQVTFTAETESLINTSACMLTGRCLANITALP